MGHKALHEHIQKTNPSWGLINVQQNMNFEASASSRLHYQKLIFAASHVFDHRNADVIDPRATFDVICRFLFQRDAVKSTSVGKEKRNELSLF